MSDLQDAINKINAASTAMQQAATSLQRHNRTGGGGGGSPPGGNPPGEPAGGNTGGSGRRAGEALGNTFKDRTTGASAQTAGREFSEEFGSRFETRLLDEQFEASKQFFIRTGRLLTDFDNDLAPLQQNLAKTFQLVSEDLRSFSEQPGQAFGSLVSEMTNSVTALQLIAEEGGGTNKRIARDLMSVTAAYAEMGVQTQQTTGIVESATMAYNLSGEQTTGLLLSFKDLNTELGVPVQKLMEDYRALQEGMSYSLDRINSEFKKLSVTARSTGIPMNKLTQAFGESMDSFDASAGKAGRLNALLGGSFINSMELLGQTESERIEYIKNAIDSAGVSLQSLTAGKGFGLKALSKEMGLSPEDTRKLLSGKSDEVMAKLREAGADPEKPLINSQKDLTSATKQLTNALVASHDVGTQYRIQMTRALDDAMVRSTGKDKESWSRFQYLTTAIDKMMPKEKLDPETRGQIKFFEQFREMDPKVAYGILNANQQILGQLNQKLENKLLSTVIAQRTTDTAIKEPGLSTAQTPAQASAAAAKVPGATGGQAPPDLNDPMNLFKQQYAAKPIPMKIAIDMGPGQRTVTLNAMASRVDR